MAITSLPKPLPVDLKVVESLIKERTARIDEIDSEIKIKQDEKNNLKEEIGQLQDVGKRLLGITPREKKEKPDKDPKTGEKLN